MHRAACLGNNRQVLAPINNVTLKTTSFYTTNVKKGVRSHSDRRFYRQKMVQKGPAQVHAQVFVEVPGIVYRFCNGNLKRCSANSMRKWHS